MNVLGSEWNDALMSADYEFCADKNRKLKEERGIDFSEIIYCMNNGGLIDVVQHHNKEKYALQQFYVVDVDGYIHLIPFVQNGDKVFLKTIFPSRKHTRKYQKQIHRRKGSEC
ncbi:MAG: toxin [Gammaproteobacteria bacterium]|nr:toxin [Gammaproteobacteria bacterium]